MLSYQHAFHAGNHADIIKHLALIQGLVSLSKKDKGFFYLDTHAGAGAYQIDDAKMQKKAEYQAGLIDLLTHIKANESPVPPLLACYARLMQKGLEQACVYGSPVIASDFIRAQDQAHFCELNPDVARQLRLQLSSSSAKTTVHNDNGFAQLKAMMPPLLRRGIVLIDPPYEQAEEYTSSYQAIKDALKRWHNGCFMLWYPILSKYRTDRISGEQSVNPKSPLSDQMRHDIIALAPTSLLDIKLNQTNAQQQGMTGSGVLVINPPFQFDEALSEALAWVCQHLQGGDIFNYDVEWLIKAP